METICKRDGVYWVSGITGEEIAGPYPRLARAMKRHPSAAPGEGVEMRDWYITDHHLELGRIGAKAAGFGNLSAKAMSERGRKAAAARDAKRGVCRCGKCPRCKRNKYYRDYRAKKKAKQGMMTADEWASIREANKGVKC